MADVYSGQRNDLNSLLLEGVVTAFNKTKTPKGTPYMTMAVESTRYYKDLETQSVRSEVSTITAECYSELVTNFNGKVGDRVRMVGRYFCTASEPPRLVCEHLELQPAKA